MNLTNNFIYYNEHNVSISEYINNSNSTTIMPQENIYINSISNIHDLDSLIEFYRLLFGGHPFVLITCVFAGIYIGCMIIDEYRSNKVVKKQ